MTTTHARRRGFTMVELLVVVMIIGILVGMLFPVLGLIKRQQKKATTKHMMTQLQTALIQYLSTYPILGLVCDDRSSDFVDSPWTFLGRNPKANGDTPYIDMLPKLLATGTAAGPWGGATQANGDQILDAFTAGDKSNHYVWAIVNKQRGGNGPFLYTDEIWIRSTCGTPADPKDDLIIHFTLSNGQWTSLTYGQARGTTTLPTYFGIGAYDPTFTP